MSPHPLPPILLSNFSWLYGYGIPSRNDYHYKTRIEILYKKKRRAVQPPILFHALIYEETTGITEPWPERRPREPWHECHHPSREAVQLLGSTPLGQQQEMS